jgi:hypothetical protein
MKLFILSISRNVQGLILAPQTAKPLQSKFVIILPVAKKAALGPTALMRVHFRAVLRVCEQQLHVLI